MEIEVFDNAVPFKVKDRMNDLAHGTFFKLGWKDSKRGEDNLYSAWTPNQLTESNILLPIQNCIAQTKWFTNTVLENIIINLVRPNDVYYIHHHHDWQVALYYINLEWEDGWHGETLFYDSKDLDKIIFTSVFKPGRIVLFDGNIPHAIRPQSIIAPKYRMSLTLLYGKNEKRAIN